MLIIITITIAIILSSFVLLMWGKLFKHYRQQTTQSKEKPKPKIKVKETQLSKTERAEMLDNVVNLARQDPQRTAGIVREWMREEKKPP